ncbi:hypothetical protein ACG3SL_17410 [Sphingomonas sp. CJ20]
MEDAVHEAQTPHDHPVLAILGGNAVLVLAAVAAPLLAAPRPMAALVLGGGGLGLALWLVGLVVTVRYASLAWKLGSLVLLIAAGAGAGLIAHAQYQTRARADASSFAEIEFAPNGAPLMPADASARGPVSARFVQSLKADLADQRAFADAMGAFGLGALNSPYLLQQDPRAIQHCAGLDAIKDLARKQSARRGTDAAALRAAIAAATLPPRARQGMLQIAAATNPDPATDTLLANQIAMLDASGELCALLARRSWFNAGGYFGFNSPADRAQFQAIGARRLALAAEMARAERAVRARMEEGRTLVRDQLSRSVFTS